MPQSVCISLLADLSIHSASGRTSDSDDTEKENVNDVDLRQLSGQKAPAPDAAAGDAKKSGFHE